MHVVAITVIIKNVKLKYISNAHIWLACLNLFQKGMRFMTGDFRELLKAAKEQSNDDAFGSFRVLWLMQLDSDSRTMAKNNRGVVFKRMRA